MTADQHVELSSVLHSLQGFVVLSGYHHPLYDQLYHDWPIRQHSVTLHARRSHGKKATEVLWLSPNANRYQLSFF